MLTLNMSNCFRIALILFVFPLLVNAQNEAVVKKYNNTDGIRGEVLDDYGRPVRNVQVSIKGTKTVVFTDSLGTFNIKTPTEGVISFENSRFYTSEVPINNDNSLVVRLKEKFIYKLDDIDVLYGVTDGKTFLGSASTVYTNEISTTPGTIYPYALTGRMPGLFTKQVSGFKSAATSANSTVNIFLGNISISGLTPPNDNSEINLRVRGLNPVTIIDGVQRDIFSIDPENIESISVLKDALSTVLLGQRSSRGILLVTTKKGKIGKPRISLTAQTGLQQPLGIPEPLSSYQYAYLYNEALQNEGRPPIYSSKDFQAYRDGSDFYLHPDVNWYKTVLEDYSPLTRYNLNIGGGGATAQYSVSLNYTDQDGMFKEGNLVDYNTNAFLKRYVLNTNVNINVNKNFMVGLQIFGRLQNGNQPGVGISDILSNLRAIPNNTNAVYNPNGTFGGISNDAFKKNLLAKVINSGYIKDDMRDVMANLDLKYNLNNWIKGLSVTGKTNVAIESANSITRKKHDVSYRFNVNSIGDTSYIKLGDPEAQTNNFTPVFNSRFWFGQAAVNYERSFDKHNFTAAIIADQRRIIYNFDLPGVSNNLSGKTGYNYANKYFAEAIINYSGFNRYEPGSQYGAFYAAGLGWELANEDFVKENLKWLNQFKIRATYGKTGNGVDNSTYYNYRSTFSADNGIGGGVYVQGTSRTPGSGFKESAFLANTNTTWEKANKFSAGLDMAVFNNHLQLVVDYYRDKYYDLIQRRGKSPSFVGISYPDENIGKRLNTGLELSSTYQNNINNLNYFISANVSFENAKTLFIDEQDQPFPWLVRTGLHPDTPFGYIADGLFQSVEEIQNSASTSGYIPLPGDIKYKDLNNDGVIDQFDVAPLLKLKPKVYYGLTLGFNYKSVEFSALVQGVKNTVVYNSDPGFIFVLFGNGQAYETILNRWTPETAATATYPRLSTYSSPNNTANSSFWLRSNDFFRLKNVNLAYNIPYKFTKKIGVSGLKIFVNAENLLTWAEDTRYSMDPEVNFTSYPIQRVYNLGVNLKL